MCPQREIERHCGIIFTMKKAGNIKRVHETSLPFKKVKLETWIVLMENTMEKEI